jgi:hypothetical protein
MGTIENVRNHNQGIMEGGCGNGECKGQYPDKNRLPKIEPESILVVNLSARTVGHWIPPPISVPLFYRTEGYRYALRAILLYHWRPRHFSSIVPLNDKWYSCENPDFDNWARSTSLTLLGTIAAGQTHWNGELGRSDNVSISMVVFQRENATS